MVWNRQGIKKIKIQSLYKFNIIDRFAKLNFKVFKDKYRGKSMLFLKKR